MGTVLSRAKTIRIYIIVHQIIYVHSIYRIAIHVRWVLDTHNLLYMTDSAKTSLVRTKI